MSYLILQNPITKEIKQVPTGFSFTTLFFGFLPALIRGDLLGSLVLIVPILVMLFVPAFILVVAILNIAFACMYNSWYIERLTANGWETISIK